MIKSGQIISINRDLPIIGEVGDLSVENELGQSKYGKIWRLRDQSDKRKYYVLEHIQNIANQDTILNLKTALEAEAEFDFLPQVYDLIQLEDGSVIVLGEYLEGLPLLQWITNHANRPWKSKKAVFIELLNTVKTIQQRDPAFLFDADKVMVTPEDKLKFCDHGIISYPMPEAPMVAYSAPEYHLNQQNISTTRANVFTLGSVLYAFVKGLPYWKSEDNESPYSAMIEGGELRNSNILDTFDTTFEYPVEVAKAVRIATNFRAEKRFSSIDAFLRHFRQETLPDVQSLSTEPVFKSKNTSQQPLKERTTNYKLRKGRVALIVALLLAAFAFGGFYFLGDHEKTPKLTIDERKDWNTAIDKNTEYFYHKYLANHPNGEYTALAWDMIDTIYNAPVMERELMATRFTGKYAQSGDSKIFSMRFTEITPNAGDYDFKCSVNMGSQRKALIGSIDMDSYAISFEELGEDYPKLSIVSGRLYKRQNKIFIESTDVEQYWVLRD